MKKISILLILILIVSCSEKEDTIVNNMTVSVFYTTNPSGEVIYPDIGAKIFIYFDKASYDFMYYTYEKDGIFTLDTTQRTPGYLKDKILPDQKNVTDNTGLAVLIPYYTDRIFSVFIESEFYSKRLTHFVFPSASYPIKIETTFEP